MIFKKYLPTSLFGRTFLIVMIPVLLLQIAVTLVFFERHWSKMSERLAYAVAGEMMSAIDKINENPDNLNDVQSLVKNRLGLDMHYRQNYATFPDDPEQAKNAGKKFLFVSWRYDTAIKNDLAHEIEIMTDIPFQIHVLQDQKQIMVHFMNQNDLISFTIPERRLFSSSSYIFILWMMGLSLLLFTISMMFMRNQIRPIHRLGIIAERLGRGVPVGKIKPSGAREVRQAAEAFMRMQDRINQFITGRTTLLAGVSHDLRTPLTRMKLQLEMMDESADTAAMRSDIHDMEQMIEGYLSFARGDGGEAMVRIPLKDILDKVIEDGHRLGLNIIDNRQGKDTAIIWAKPLSLGRAFNNFIINSNHYADKMSIKITMDDEWVTIVFEDDGDGITPDKITEVLKPFVRGDASRNQKTGGVGLGLTIANDIIISHGGTLTLSSTPDLGGLQVSVKLPL